MCLFELNKESEELERLQSLLGDYTKARNALDFKGHQQSMNVIINGCVSITVTEMDRGYIQMPKRGMDMIVLGAKKLYNAKISEVENLILASKNKIKQLANDIAEQGS